MPIDPARPIYWTWGEPLGDAAADGNVIQIVRPKMLNVTYRDGAACADLAADEIIARGLVAGEVSILIWNFGDTSAISECRLWRNPLDGIATLTDAPFYAQGIAEARVFTGDFVTRYKQRMKLDGIPSPTAFWMDTENRIIVNADLFARWDDLKADPRWATEPIMLDGRTWADLAVPEPNKAFAWNVAENAQWIRGVREGLLEGQAQAFKQAFDQIVASCFPAVLLGNWVTSHDGAYVGGESSGLTNWNGHGTHQCPVLYGNADSWQSWVYGAASGRDEVAPLEYALKVQPGAFTGRPYAPWMLGPLVGAEAAGYYDAIVRRGVQDGIRHFLVWQDDAVTGVLANWNSFAASIATAEADVTSIPASTPADASKMLGAFAD